MISANELRIGNLVQRTIVLDILNERKFALVDPIMIRDCEYYKDNWAFEPIPLTPEILEKCGFEWDDRDDDNKWLVLYYGRYKLMTDESSGFNLVNAYVDNKFINNYRYLHQLQNIFFFATGEELSISI